MGRLVRCLLTTLAMLAAAPGMLRAEDYPLGATSAWPPPAPVYRVSALDWDPGRTQLGATPQPIGQPERASGAPVMAEGPSSPWRAPLANQPQSQWVVPGSQPHHAPGQPGDPSAPQLAGESPRVDAVYDGAHSIIPTQMTGPEASQRRRIVSTVDTPTPPTPPVQVADPGSLVFRGEPAYAPPSPQPRPTHAVNYRHDDTKPKPSDSPGHPVYEIPIDQIPQEWCDEEKWYVGPLDPRTRPSQHLEPDRDRLWYTRLEALYWGRQNPGPETLAVGATNGSPLLDAQDIDFGFSMGVRAGIGRSIPDSGDVEFIYSGITRDKNRLTVGPVAGGMSSLFSEADPLFAASVYGPFNQADSFTLQYNWQLHDFQWNYNAYVGSFMGMHAHAHGGMRYTVLDESLDLFAQTNAGGISQYGIRATSHLFGPHAGGGLHYPLGDGNWITVHGGTGLMISGGKQTSRIDSFVGRRETSATDMTVAPMLEFGTTARAELGPRAEVFAGYNMLLLSGLTLASEQVDWATGGSAQRGIDNRGTAFFHGFNGGMSVRW